ncbi:hypothetical protein N6B72_03770 [Chryseobacterium soli]|uniref:hypothetical protein n=1 Tax=Chryseobacterium soli TaxID=445961 RepID=UPI002953EEAA|nr:hypothetical protein [Chryseobacterium soli]MDV7696032.1 hypothetical protein [Chryseobacterium soli]
MMKRFYLISLSVFLFTISCKKENTTISHAEDAVNVADLENMTDEKKLEFFSKREFKGFTLNNFIIKKINDHEIIPNNKNTLKADFSVDKIDFNVRINFTDKTKFYSVSDKKIMVSDDKEKDYFSANDNRYFISGYFNEGKFYFDKVNKLGS